MKKTALFLLVLTLGISVSGCGEEESVQIVSATELGQTKEAVKMDQDETELNWKYEITKQKTEDQFTSDDGVVLARTSYEIPVMEVKAEVTSGSSGNSDLQEKVPKDMQEICDAFNAGIKAFGESFETVVDLSVPAKEHYGYLEEEYRKTFPTYYETTEVTEIYETAGGLYDVQFFSSIYYGGAHGSGVYENFHFDSTSGKFVKLGDLTDRKRALNEMLTNEILSEIYNKGEQDWFFEDFYETIATKTDFDVAFKADGMHVYFTEYEIAPYAYGIPEFVISYPKLYRFLNDDGKRILSCSIEDQILGDFLEAQDLWYWFDGGAPVDYTDQKTIHVKWQDGSEWDEPVSRLDYSGIMDLDTLKKFFLTRFSEELVDRKLAEAMEEGFVFNEIDGALYVRGLGRGDDLTIGNVEYSVELNAEKTAGKVIVKIYRQDYDETKGDWVLTGETDAMEFPFELGEKGAIFSEMGRVY